MNELTIKKYLFYVHFLFFYKNKKEKINYI